jgi:hypothetical protein
LYINAGDTKAGVRELHHQRETHVSQPDHAYVRLVCLDLSPQFFEMIRHVL